jgi:DNA polymerase-1
MSKNSAKQKKRLVLIDGHALLHRAFHAMPDLTTSKGERIEAIYGFLRMLLRAIDDLQPTHLAIAFDRPVPTFRHKMFANYQAQRPPMDESLKTQQARLRQVIQGMEIPIYELDGYEADDLVGTLVDQAVEDKGEAIVVTGDRDLLQLVRGEKIKICTPRRGLSDSIVWNEKTFIGKYGFKPQQLVDFKGLVGDQSDNYPGVAGIGEKTAKKLLTKYSSLEEIYKHKDRIEEKVRKKLVLGKDDAFLSKQLAQICHDAPVQLSWKNSKLTNFRSENLIKLFQELEFGSLSEKVLSYEVGASDEPVTEEEDEASQMELL